MIGSLKGLVGFLGPDCCIIETTGGVGYIVHMPSSHLTQLSIGSEVYMFVHTTVREDAITLYGFLTREYYDLFQLLLTVSGIGPKSALGILSVVKPETFYLAVQNRDIKGLIKLPGIGKKTAERIVLELKDKISEKFKNNYNDHRNVPIIENNTAVSEAIEGLQSLGYTNSEIMPIINQIKDCDKLRGEEILRQALKLFGKNSI